MKRKFNPKRDILSVVGSCLFAIIPFLRGDNFGFLHTY